MVSWQPQPEPRSLYRKLYLLSIKAGVILYPKKLYVGGAPKNFLLKIKLSHGRFLIIDPHYFNLDTLACVQ
jgi:hypothetical protein